MQEIKQSFPGNRISGFLSEMSKWLLGAIVLVSLLEWETPPNTSLAVHFGIEGTYVPFVAVLVVALLSYQHKAVFMRRDDEDKVHFWKQITPYFIYGKREINVGDLSYYVKRRKTRDNPNANITDANYGETTTTTTTYLYQNKKKFFVLDGKTDYFREILGKGPSRRPLHKNSLVDLVVNFIRRG